MARRRWGLAARMALLTTCTALLAVLVTGLVAGRLVRDAAVNQAATTLGREADLVGQIYDRPRLAASRATLVNRLLTSQKIALFVVDGNGTVLSRSGAAADLALPADDAATLAAGTRFQHVRTVAGRRIIVVGRPIPDGGVALVQPASQAREISTPLWRRIGIALLIGLAAAAAAGVGLAWRLARPLRAAAAAARLLATGRRDVRLSPGGPAEIAEVGEALDGLASALLVSEGRQRDFLLSVSHELRTPLTAVRGFAEALADGVTPPGDVAATGQVILGEATRLERLVSDLLDLARLGADDFRIDPAPVDLTALVAAAGDVWRARCRADGVPLLLEVPPFPVVVVTDGVRVRQIIDGLAENALRVVPAGAPMVFALRPEVGFDAGNGDGWVAVEVRDSGPGLTPDDCAVAFERSVLYERYRGIRRVGTGVGLALVAGLATRLGGVADAGRAREGGARFTIHLPAGR